MFKSCSSRSFVSSWLGWMWLFAGLTGGLVLADPPSQIFRAEGPGGSSYYSPDEERSRITASAQVVTPHLEWGRPWAAGPLRVLAIAHKEAGRWPIELSQRFDLRITTIYTHSREALGVRPGGPSHGSWGRINQRPEDVEARLRQAMNRPLDVIINGVPLATLGPNVQERLTQLLHQGVGYVGPTKGLELEERPRDEEAERGMVQAAVPLAGLRTINPTFESLPVEKMIQLWQGRNGGRVADLSGFVWEETPPDPRRLQYLWLVDLPWEAWCSLTARAALWAARRLPAATTLEVTWPREALRWAEMPCSLPVKGNTDDRVSLRVWDADGRLRHQGENLTLPRLPTGLYFVGLQCSSQQGISDWAFGSIEVITSQRIASVAIDDQYKRIEDKIVAAITLEGDLERGSTVQLEVLDNYGRCIFARETAARKQVLFIADLRESLHMYNYVNARLFDKAHNLVDEARHAFYIRQPGPPRDDLITMVWDPRGRLPDVRSVVRRFVELGMQAGLSGIGWSLAVADVHPVRYNYRLSVQADDQGEASPNIASEPYIQDIQAKMRDTVRELAPFSPLFYYLGDDTRYLGYGEDGGWDPEQRASLAEWAMRTYGDLDQINQAWGTQYTDLGQIEPIKTADALAAVRHDGAPRYGPLCHWVDHQLHTDDLVMRFYRRLGEAINEVDTDTPSNAGTSVVGWSHPSCGVDFWQMAENQKMVIQYPNPWVHEVYRSALAPDALHGIWYGGYGLYNYPPFYLDQDFLPWWGVFHGVNLHGLYYGATSPQYNDERLLAADLSFMPGVAKIVAHHKELKSGVAKLLFNAHRVNDGVAIVYSPSSIHASAVFDQGLPKAPEWADQQTASDLFLYMQCWEGLAYLLGDLGLSFDVVPSSQLRDGQFLERGFRVLVLPLNLRVTAAEAETIRRFVDAGGILLADAFPGLLDEGCRPDHPGVLAKVLGVGFPGAIPGPQVKLAPASTEDGTELGRMVADGGLTLAGAQASGRTEDGTPIFTVHRYGRGSAIVLNVLARDYQIWRTAATEMPFRSAVGRLLADAGIELYPDVKLVVGTGGLFEHPIQVTEVHRYELDGAKYVGILRHHKLRPDDAIYMADLRPKPVSMKFDHRAHVYDIRGAMYRGHTDTIEDMIYPAHAELYALLPYEVWDLQAQAQWESGAITLSAEIVPGKSEAKPVTHVFHVELTDPEGQVHPALSGNVLAPNGQCNERIFVGYNAKSGMWNITVRDVASGMAKEVFLRRPEG